MRRQIFYALILAALADPTLALDPGERLFGLHCAVCHGETATGGGPMADALRIAVPDLTTLSLRNDGDFPLSRTVAQIDGRDPLQAHGGTMPVYGWFFEGPKIDVATPDGRQEKTTEAIAQIVRWLQSVQKSP